MISKIRQWLILGLLVAFCLEFAWELANWHESTTGLGNREIAATLIGRTAFMAVLLRIYLCRRKSPPVSIANLTQVGQLRTVRIVHRTLIAAVVLYIVLAEMLAKPIASVPPLLAESFGILAILLIIVAFSFRRKWLPQANEIMKRDPQDAQALGRWRKAQILTMVLMVSVALFGFSLRFMGGSFWAALPFFTASLALLLLWRPRLELAPNDGASTSPPGN